MTVLLVLLFEKQIGHLVRTGTIRSFDVTISVWLFNIICHAAKFNKDSEKLFFHRSGGGDDYCFSKNKIIFSKLNLQTLMRLVAAIIISWWKKVVGREGVHGNHSFWVKMTLVSNPRSKNQLFIVIISLNESESLQSKMFPSASKTPWQNFLTCKK